MLYSFVIPCYKSSKTIRKVVEMTMQEMDRLGRREYEFVLVDDCSPDDGEKEAEMYLLLWTMICRHIRPSLGRFFPSLIKALTLYMDIMSIRNTVSSVISEAMSII